MKKAIVLFGIGNGEQVIERAATLVKKHEDGLGYDVRFDDNGEMTAVFLEQIIKVENVKNNKKRFVIRATASNIVVDTHETRDGDVKEVMGCSWGVFDKEQNGFVARDGEIVESNERKDAKKLADHLNENQDLEEQDYEIAK